MKRCSLIAFALLGMFSCKKAATVDCSTVTFSSTIQPLINSRCATSGCHAAGSSNGALTGYDLVYARYKNGQLKSSVVDRKSMPQGNSLSSTELKQFECWINSGAPNN